MAWKCERGPWGRGHASLKKIDEPRRTWPGRGARLGADGGRLANGGGRCAATPQTRDGCDNGGVHNLKRSYGDTITGRIASSVRQGDDRTDGANTTKLTPDPSLISTKRDASQPTRAMRRKHEDRTLVHAGHGTMMATDPSICSMPQEVMHGVCIAHADKRTGAMQPHNKRCRWAVKL